MENVRTANIIEVLEVETIKIGDSNVTVMVDKSGFIVIKPTSLQTLINVHAAIIAKPLLGRIEKLEKQFELLDNKVKVKIEQKVEKIIKENDNV